MGVRVNVPMDWPGAKPGSFWIFTISLTQDEAPSVNFDHLLINQLPKMHTNRLSKLSFLVCISTIINRSFLWCSKGLGFVFRRKEDIAWEYCIWGFGRLPTVLHTQLLTILSLFSNCMLGYYVLGAPKKSSYSINGCNTQAADLCDI